MTGLPPTEQLLVAGGDARVALADDSGRNRYGCRPVPDPALAAFGSATASTVSTGGFAAAEALRGRLVAAGEGGAQLELARVRRVLAGLAERDGTEVVFAASGTDLHLLVAQLVASGGRGPALAVVVEPSETGSGVPAALAARHFSTRTAMGQVVVAGEALAGAAQVEVANVPLRTAAGALREAEAVDADLEVRASAAAGAGRRVLLVLVDGSKTGAIAPSPALASALVQRYPGRVEVFVDACQFRLSPASLQAYLDRGFLVALTGSKFLTGPTFSGALLVPSGAAQRLRDRPLPAALAAYTSRHDWPAGWAAAAGMAEAPNLGLLLRWEAALHELQAFRAVPEAWSTAFLQAFARAVEAHLADEPRFEPVPVAPLDRGPIGGWDRVPTIFPFLLRRNGRAPLTPDETARVYQWLQEDLPGRPTAAALRCQLGQPVPCGVRAGAPVSALRLCASARLVVEAYEGEASAVIGRAIAALDKAAWLLGPQGG